MSASLTVSPARVRRLTDRREIQAILEQDRPWAAYALGDLDDGMFERCDCYASGEGFGLVFKGLHFIPFFTLGAPEGISAIISSAMRQPVIHMAQRPEHMPVLLDYYRPQEKHVMWRICLRDFQPVRGNVVRLGMDRLAAMRALYAGSDGGTAFAPYQLATGYFFGVEQDGRLVSIAGVHLASRRYRVGPVGNIYTHPDYRRHGYAAQCTSAVIAALRSDGIDTIVLNVDETNTTAIRVYQRLGFDKHCEFIEGAAVRRET
ncbi:MAG: GNAT family N-acetyltransferase [Chloroflexi bacterium]|nr:MAG: GNAT family N-acetyltransferase [Chloroflexota bacterium]